MKDFILQLDWPAALLLIVIVVTVGHLANLFIRVMTGGLDGIVYIDRNSNDKNGE